MFDNLAAAPADPILSLNKLFINDTGSNKVDMGIGIYKDENGDACILPSVKQAEAWLLEEQQTKGYLSSAGNPDYNREIRALILGGDTDGFKRARTVQAPGGTGALRLAADFFRKFQPKGRIFIPNPTWANHKSLFGTAGLEIVPYPYYDIARGELRFDEMMSALSEMTADDILLLHGCCHNPSGADPDISQWQQIADLLSSTGATPLIDLAYQGFGDGLEEDVRGVRLLAGQLPEMLIASSCSKNFALYRERVGALTFVGQNEHNASLAHDHLLPIIRGNYSMPPDHGAAVVAHILGQSSLRTQWQKEVDEMRTRIHTMRKSLVAYMAEHSARDFSFLERQRGMFALFDLSPEQVKKLRAEHHVHITGSGRANVAGLNEKNVEWVAKSIALVVQS